MISDILWQTEQDLKEYFKDPYRYSTEIRQRVEKLIEEMQAIRLLPGMDTPPDLNPLEGLPAVPSQQPL